MALKIEDQRNGDLTLKDLQPNTVFEFIDHSIGCNNVPLFLGYDKSVHFLTKNDGWSAACFGALKDLKVRKLNTKLLIVQDSV